VKKADVIRKQLDYAFVSNPESGEKTRSDEGNATSYRSSGPRPQRRDEKKQEKKSDKKWPSGKAKRKK
jgi:hypothetical protein